MKKAPHVEPKRDGFFAALGGNYIRIWNQILPDERQSCVPASTKTV